MFTGQVLANRYTIISELATGGMGITYRAWDQISLIPVVIKLPNLACRADPTLLARFRREINLMETLPHSHIVPILDKGEFQGRPFVAMRFLPGGSLSDRVTEQKHQNRAKHFALIGSWLPAIAEALDFLHLNNVIHRDVKPSNIFFDAFWTPFLGDFGLAKDGRDLVEQDLTATNAGLGTLSYTAPEQMQRSKSVDGRADQYSLAVTVFECLAGRKPFTGEEHHIIVEILQHEPPDLATIVPLLPQSLCVSIGRALSRSPRQRFESCADFCRAVLQDVPPWQATNDIARMLCPACDQVIKLRLTAAGQTGRCPKCQTPMTASSNLSAFWLVTENPTKKPVGNLEDLPEALPATAGADANEDIKLLDPLSKSSAVNETSTRYFLEKTLFFGMDLDPFVVLNLISGALVVLASAVLITLWVGPCTPQSRPSVLAPVTDDSVATGPRELTEKGAADLVEGKDGEDPLREKVLLVRGYGRLADGASDVLAGAGRTLDLSDLEKLDSESAKSFEGFEYELILDGLKTLDVETARSLALCKNRLELEGLKELNSENAKALSGYRGGQLWLSGLQSLDAESAAFFASFEGALVLDGLTQVSAEVAESLARSKGFLKLNGLENIDPEVAKKLAVHEGSISLRALREIDFAAALEFANSNHTVYLLGIQGIDDRTAVALAQFNGENLYLRAQSLEGCSETAREKLSGNEKVSLIETD